MKNLLDDRDCRLAIWERVKAGKLSADEILLLLETAGPPQTPEQLKHAQALAHRIMLIHAWQLRVILQKRIAFESQTLEPPAQYPPGTYRRKLQRIINALDRAFEGEQMGGPID